jgi:hypothetical protein
MYHYLHTHTHAGAAQGHERKTDARSDLKNKEGIDACVAQANHDRIEFVNAVLDQPSVHKKDGCQPRKGISLSPPPFPICVGIPESFVFL